MQVVRDADELKSVISSNPIVVVKFSTPWCTVCKVISKVFDAVAPDYPDVSFVEADASQEAIMEAFNIRSVPATAFYVNGEERDSIMNAFSEGVLRKKLEELAG